MPAEQRPRHWFDFPCGFVAHLLATLVVPSVPLAAYWWPPAETVFVVGGFLWMFIGFSQLLWGVPLALLAGFGRRPGAILGIVGAMALVVLLNGTCGVVAMALLSNASFH